MQVKLTNIVDNTADNDSEFIPSSGLSYLIELGGKTVLFDAGDQGHILVHNMNLLNIDPNSIDLLVLSHGHWDHTFGLKALMGIKRNLEKLKIDINLFEVDPIEAKEVLKKRKLIVQP